MAAVYPAAFRKEVREPQRKIAAADLRVVRADRIVRHDEAALHDVDEIGLSYLLPPHFAAATVILFIAPV